MSDIFANKYRPKCLEDIVGQDVVKKSLLNSFKNKRMHHFYIFEGVYGTGKTTCARILAAMENCDNGPTANPCGVCKNCKEIFSGKSIDVKELDAASNRSIEDIRDIKNNIQMSANNGRVKYIIIDECHSLTGYAAEAALKMVEEPPAHVRFIFATTDSHKLKDTIFSRCMPFRFNKVNWMDMSSHLDMVCKKEHIEIEKEALDLIAKSSRGSVRSSLQSLEKALAYVGLEETITVQGVYESLGLVAQELYFNLFKSIIEKKSVKTFLIINKIMGSGQQVSKTVDDLTDFLNDLLVIQQCGDQSSELGYSPEDIKKFQYLASKFGMEKIIFMISKLCEITKAIEVNVKPDALFNNFAIEIMHKS